MKDLISIAAYSGKGWCDGPLWRLSGVNFKPYTTPLSGANSEHAKAHSDRRMFCSLIG